MPKKIEVVINPEGKLETNFIGFAGEECFDEAERLRGVLKALGLLIDPIEVVRKDPGLIARETGEREEEEDEKKARSGRGDRPAR
ncbi:MAG TPA: hypothetical protein VGL40_03165 [Bacillota bacterium]|jgi:hypothetical protein